MLPCDPRTPPPPLQVLFTLDFGLAVPTPLRFLHYMLQLAHLPAHPGEALSCRRLAEALLELSLLDLALLGAPASAVAGAAVYLALGMRRHHEGLQGVVLLSGADPADLGDLVQVGGGKGRVREGGREGEVFSGLNGPSRDYIGIFKQSHSLSQLFPCFFLILFEICLSPPVLGGLELTCLHPLPMCRPQRLSRNLHEAASSPQPCALLCRYKAWEGLHGRTALAIAAATAAQQNAAMAPAAPPMAAAAMDTDLTAAAAAPAPAAGVMDHEVEFEAEPHAPSPPPVLRQQQLSRPSSSSAAHHLPAHYAAQQPASAHGHAAHTGAAAYHMPAAAALAAAGGLVAASAGAAALMSGAHGHPHPIHHHHVMSLAVHHVPTTATIATSVGAAAALGGLRLSSAACC